MSIENAEIAKISVNAFLTTKITFANMLADICSRIPGGNVDVDGLRKKRVLRERTERGQRKQQRSEPGTVDHWARGSMM